MFKLITLLGSGIPAIIGGLLAFIARKAGTGAASLVTFAALTLAFLACNQAIFNTIATMLSPPPWVSTAIGMFIPANFLACLSAWVSAHICRAAFDMARFKVKLVNSAS